MGRRLSGADHSCFTATAANGIVPILAVTLGPSSSPGAFVGASRQRQRSRLARPIGKAANKKTAQALGESTADLGVSRDDSCSATHLGDEFQTEPSGMGLVKLGGSDKLCFSVQMETDAPHRSFDLAFRKTLSAGRLSTVPARSSSSLRSASSAQSCSAPGSF